MAAFGLHCQLVDQIHRSALEWVLLGRHGKDQGVIFGRRVAGTAHDRGEFRKERGEAVDGCAAPVVSARDIRFRGGPGGPRPVLCRMPEH